MSYLSRLKAEAGKQPDGEPSKGAKGAFDGFEGGGAARFHGLPAEIVAGLLRLEVMRPPRMAKPSNWPGIVRDCLMLGSDGWAGQALAKGWSPLRLWGVSPAIGGIADIEGLGIWLNGRSIIRIEPDFCEIQNGPSKIAWFNPRLMDGAVLLWDLGRWGGGG